MLIVLPAVELPASLFDTALAIREAETESKHPGHQLSPCWRTADDSINCPVVKRDADGGMLSYFALHCQKPPTHETHFSAGEHTDHGYRQLAASRLPRARSVVR